MAKAAGGNQREIAMSVRRRRIAPSAGIPAVRRSRVWPWIVVVVSALAVRAGAPVFAQPSVPAALDAMRTAKQKLDRAVGSHEKAKAWRALQQAADDLVRGLPQDLSNEQCYDSNKPGGLRETCPGYPVVKQAQAVGMWITYCGSGEAWLPTNRGWAEYLKLWPDGPDADRAWWNVNVAPPCCDECSFESAEAERRVCREFINRFPKSPLRQEAERRMRSAVAPR